MTFWVFQGNPDEFDIDTYLKQKFEQKSPIRWRVKQYRNEIKINDIIFIWRAKGRSRLESGIIAKGVVLTKPKEMEDDAPHLWKKRPTNHRIIRVIIELLDIRLTEDEGMIKREVIEKELPNFPVLKQPHQTNYKLKPEYACFINTLWEQKTKQIKNRK